MFDFDLDGQISAPEYYTAVGYQAGKKGTTLSLDYVNQQVKDFNNCDSDNDGFITREELI